jgi:hypothetical protein
VAYALRAHPVEELMADTDRDQTQQSRQQNSGSPDDTNAEQIPSTDSDVERERIRSANDRDQELEREGVTSKHNRGYDQAVRGGQTGPTDPDSAESDVDRDDTVSE